MYEPATVRIPAAVVMMIPSGVVARVVRKTVMLTLY